MTIHQSTVTMTIATPCVVTWTGHGFASGTTDRGKPLGFVTTGALPTNINALGNANSMCYLESVINADTFYVSSSPANAAAGTRINTSGTQSGTHTGMEPDGLDTRRPPVALTFSASSDSVYWPAHKMLAGDQVVLDATTMPDNFKADIVHWVQSVIDADHVKLSASYMGSAITCGAGAGTAVTGINITALRLGEQAVQLSNVPLAVQVTLTNIAVGSQVRVAKVSDNSELFNDDAAASTVVFTTKFAGDANVTVRKAGYQECNITVTVESVTGGNAFISQSLDGTS